MSTLFFLWAKNIWKYFLVNFLLCFNMKIKNKNKLYILEVSDIQTCRVKGTNETDFIIISISFCQLYF